MPERDEPEPIEPSDSEPGAADNVAAQAEEFLRRQRARGERPEPDEGQQSSALDIVIEDQELEEFLALIYENAAEAKRLRTLINAGNKGLKEALKGKYQHTVNSDFDGTHTGYVRCGRFRFRPQATEHDEATTTRHQGLDWEIDIEEVGKLL